MKIASGANERFRALLALVQSSRERRKRQRSVIEGAHLIEAFVEQAANGRFVSTLRELYLSTAEDDAGLQDGQALARRIGLAPILLEEALFRQASQLKSGHGPIAVIDTPVSDLPARLTGDAVYLDRVQDPGNMGSILRSCAAAGIERVITSAGAAFCWAPKVLRAGMGAHFALTVHEAVEPAQLRSMLGDGIICRAAVAPRAAANPTPVHRADLRAPTLWLFGSEGEGLRDELLQLPRRQALTIDQVAEVESLNVGAAVAVCLFEQRRQRASS